MKKRNRVFAIVLAAVMAIQPIGFSGRMNTVQAETILPEDKEVPQLESIKLSPSDNIEEDTKVTFTIKFKEEISGLYSLDLYYENEDGDEVNVFYLEGDEDNEEVSLSGNTLKIETDKRFAGTYKFSYLSMVDKAGNDINYNVEDGKVVGYDNYGEVYYPDFSAFDTFTVKKSSKKLEDKMVVLQNVCISEEDKDIKDNLDTKNGETVTIDVTASAKKDRKVKEVYVNFYHEETKKTYTYGGFLKKSWVPGTSGDTISIETDFTGYELTGNYHLYSVDFFYGAEDNQTHYSGEWWNAEDVLEYRTTLYAYDTLTDWEDVYKYDGAADFTITENIVNDTKAPELLSIDRITSGDTYSKTEKISYEVGYAEDASGMNSIIATFYNEDEEYDHYSYFLIDEGEIPNQGKQIITSVERPYGTYRLGFLELADKAGNYVCYECTEDEGTYEVYDSVTGKTEEVTLEGKLTYKVHKHEYTVKTIESANFEKDGLQHKVCKCGKIAEEIVVPRVENIKLSYNVATYNGKVKKPSVTVWDSEGEKLSSSDYSVSYEAGRKYPGEYKVTVTLKNEYEGEQEISFRIQPKAPTSVKAVLTDDDAVKVSWKKSTGADAYHVYYKLTNSEENFTEYLEATGEEVEIKELVAGKKYDFKVIPCFDVNGECVESTKSTTVSVTTLAKVSDVKVEKSSSTKVKVSWKNVANETGYLIEWTKEDGTTDSKKYKTTSGKSTTITVPADEVVEYKVKAYKVVGKKTIEGEWSEAVSFTLRNVKAVKNVKAALHVKHDQVKVTWSEADGATGYNVSMKKGSDKYEKVVYTEKTEFIASDLSDGAKYTFKVQPCYVEDGKEIATGSSDTAVVYTLKKVTGVKLAKSSSEVKVSWTNISGESGYQVSQSASENEEEIVIVKDWKTTSGTSTKLDANKGETYYYRVRAYKIVGEDKIYGPWSDAKEYTRK